MRKDVIRAYAPQGLLSYYRAEARRKRELWRIVAWSAVVATSELVGVVYALFFYR